MWNTSYNRSGWWSCSFIFNVLISINLSSLLNTRRIRCHIDNICINHVFYGDDFCWMPPCAIALQELINVCYQYSNEIDLNFNATKSFCVAFTPKHYKLLLPSLFMNTLPILYADSIKYLGFIFASNNCDDSDILKQMRMLYCRSNRLARLFNKCSKPVLLELCRSFCTVFYCPYFWTQYKKTTFSKIRVAYNNVYRKIMRVSRLQVLVVCLSLMTFLILKLFPESQSIRLPINYHLLLISWFAQLSNLGLWKVWSGKHWRKNVHLSQLWCLFLYF